MFWVLSCASCLLLLPLTARQTRTEVSMDQRRSEIVEPIPLGENVHSLFSSLQRTHAAVSCPSSLSHLDLFLRLWARRRTLGQQRKHARRRPTTDETRCSPRIARVLDLDAPRCDLSVACGVGPGTFRALVGALLAPC